MEKNSNCSKLTRSWLLLKSLRGTTLLCSLFYDSTHCGYHTKLYFQNWATLKHSTTGGHTLHTWFTEKSHSIRDSRLSTPVCFLRAFIDRFNSTTKHTAQSEQADTSHHVQVGCVCANFLFVVVLGNFLLFISDLISPSSTPAGKINVPRLEPLYNQCRNE